MVIEGIWWEIETTTKGFIGEPTVLLFDIEANTEREAIEIFRKIKPSMIIEDIYQPGTLRGKILKEGISK